MRPCRRSSHPTFYFLVGNTGWYNVNGDSCELDRMSLLLLRSRTIFNNYTKYSTRTMSALSSFSSCELSDALLKLGVESGGYIPDISQFSGKSICGQAYTVKFVSSTDTEAPKLSEHFMDTAPSNSVIVIDVPQRSVIRISS